MAKERCERCGHRFDKNKHKDVGRPGSDVFTVEHYMENNIGYLRWLIRRRAKLRNLEIEEEKINKFLDRLKKEAVVPEEKLKPRRVCKACYMSKGFHEEEGLWLELQEAKSIYRWLEKEGKKSNVVDELFLENYKSGEIEVLEEMFRHTKSRHQTVTSTRSVNLLSTRKIFDWFTKEIVHSKRIYRKNRLATQRLERGIKNLANKLEANCTLRRPFDARIVKHERGTRKVLLILEYENDPSWKEVERDFTKLVDSKAHMKCGIFHLTHVYDENRRREKMEDRLRKMRNILLETSPKQGREKWLLIIGRCVGKRKEKVFYTGYEWIDRDWRKIKEKELV